jgi:hypothetical protein
MVDLRKPDVKITMHFIGTVPDQFAKTKLWR